MTRRVRVEGEFAFVDLTKGYVAMIDAADADLVLAFSWRAKVKDTTVYAMSQTARPDRSCVLMHRLVAGAATGDLVDHIDGNGLNNQRLNLRTASPSQNQQNQRLVARNSSGLKGASWQQGVDKWRAQIWRDGKRVHLGYFATAEDAHAAYLTAAQDAFGEFVRAR